jgi:excisionase family DNA binding protein
VNELAPLLLTVPQAAELLQLSRRSVDRRIAAGDIAVARLGKGPRAPVRVVRDALLADLGLIGKADTRRRARQARAEQHAALAATRGTA